MRTWSRKRRNWSRCGPSPITSRWTSSRITFSRSAAQMASCSRFCGQSRPTDPISRLPSGSPSSASSWRRVVPGGAGQGHAVGDHPHPVGRRAVADVEVAHALAVDHHAAAAPGHRPVDRQLQPALPGIDAPLGDHHVRDAAGPGRRQSVGVGGEHPGMHQIGAEPGQMLLQLPERPRIELPPLADHPQRHARRGQLGGQRPAAGQGADVDLELVARQPGGQQAQLLLRAGAVEGRNDLQNALGHFISPGSSAAR